MLLRSLWLARHCLKTVNCSIGWSKIVVVENEVCMALPIFYGHSPTSLKYALHHLSPGGIFLYLASISYIISFLSSVVLHHVSEIWMTSTSSRMMIDYISEVGVASSLLWACSCSVEFLVACSDIFKVLAPFFPSSSRFCWPFLASSTSCWHLWNPYV